MLRKRKIFYDEFAYSRLIMSYKNRAKKPLSRKRTEAVLKCQYFSHQNGPRPRQEVVVMAVRAAVMAATRTLRITSQMLFFFMAF